LTRAGGLFRFGDWCSCHVFDSVKSERAAF
jgi:hypothetical protein